MLHKKAKGFMLLSAIMATLIILMIANGFMNMYGGQFTYLQAGKEASKGQQYAEIVADKIKLEGIDAEEVTDRTSLEEITGNEADSNWEYTCEIGDETEDDDGNVFKVATIKIYKEGEDSPRYTYEVPLSSSGSSDGLEVGMVVAWTLSSDPSDSYLECNGQAVDSSKYPKLYALMHNVPDYQGYFLRGLGGNSAALGTAQSDAIRNISGTISLHNLNGHDYERMQLFNEDVFATGALSLGNYANRYAGSDAENIIYLPGSFSFDASRVVPTAEENRPVNKAVRYFIKEK